MADDFDEKDFGFGLRLPEVEAREQYVRDNAVELVRVLEAKVSRQKDELTRLNRSRDDLRRENARLRAAATEVALRLGHARQTARECRSQAADLARRCGPACTREWADLAERWRWLAEAWERLAALLPPDLLRDAPAAEGGG